MSEIIRYDVNDQWAHSGMVEAGNFLFMSYCVGNIGRPIENQINDASDHLTCNCL
jgi:enamine deaminase RidA (YjgF/YER057c/UK114 family)